MMSPADRVLEATMKHTLRPKRGNREKVIAEVLEFIIKEYAYTPWDFGYNDIEFIDVRDIRNLIQELKETVTIEEVAQGITQHPRDAL